MMVQAPEEVGEGSKVPTDTHHTAIVTQPSSSQPQRKQKSKRKQRVESYEDKEILSDQEDASKQERMIDNIDQGVEITLVDKTQGRMNKVDMFGVNDLDGDEVIVDDAAGENVEQSTKDAEKEVGIVDPVTTAGEVVTTAEDVKVTTAATTSQISKDELTLAQTLIEIKAAKPKARWLIVQEPSEFRTTSSSQPSQLPQAKDKEIVEKRSKKTQAEVTEGSSKRAGDELEQESAKRQKLEKEDDSAELKRCLEIVPEDDDDVTIEATTISSNSQTIVDYKIYKEGKKSYFKIIRADGNSQSYLTFGKMFKNFNKEDLEVLWSIIKERFKKIKPMDDMDNLLFQTLKTMFEHHDSEGEHQVYKRIVRIKGLHGVTTAQCCWYTRLLMSLTKVNAASSRVTTADRVTTAGWIKTEMA
uniref:Uncharacterized protein n=1 Tax=Tanacetum cinerariifolium TaxID=118510 RepID=A0A6L2JTT1_TANCI|nr:hypothetical protein [Tanacetum cinerariifolium]